MKVHISYILQDELDERNWDLDVLAWRMNQTGGDEEWQRHLMFPRGF